MHVRPTLRGPERPGAQTAIHNIGSGAEGGEDENPQRLRPAFRPGCASVYQGPRPPRPQSHDGIPNCIPGKSRRSFGERGDALSNTADCLHRVQRTASRRSSLDAASGFTTRTHSFRLLTLALQFIMEDPADPFAEASEPYGFGFEMTLMAPAFRTH